MQVQALGRGLEILRIVSNHSEGIRLYEIAEKMGLKRTTVHNLARTLVCQGFLEQDEATRYRLGGAVGELLVTQRRNRLMSQVVDFLKAFHNRWPSLSCYYSTLINGDIIAQARIMPSSRGVPEHPFSLVLPAYYTASGLLFAAFSDSDHVDLLARKHPFNSEGIATWKSHDRFKDEVEKTRKKGYAHFPFDEREIRIAVPAVSRDQIQAGVFTFTDHAPSDEALETQINNIIEATSELIKAHVKTNGNV